MFVPIGGATNFTRGLLLISYKPSCSDLCDHLARNCPSLERFFQSNPATPPTPLTRRMR